MNRNNYKTLMQVLWKMFESYRTSPSSLNVVLTTPIVYDYKIIDFN